MSIIIANSSYRSTPSTTVPEIISIPAPVTASHTVALGATVSMDSLAVADWTAAKWYIVVTSVSGTRVQAAEIYGTHRLGANPTFGQYAMLGDSISYTASVIVQNSTLVLQITNTDTEPLTVYATRIGVPTAHNTNIPLAVAELISAHAIARSGASVVVDWFDCVNVNAVKWLVVVTDSTGRRNSSQVFGLINQTTPLILVYGVVGDPTVLYTLSSAYNTTSGPKFQLIVTNNDTVDYRVDITRIPVQTPLIDIPYSTTRGLNLWVPGSITVNPASTSVIDSQMPVITQPGVKWLGTITDNVSKTMAFELYATPTGTSCKHVMYGMIADSMPITTQVDQINNTIVFSLKNNGALPVTVNLIRIPVAL